MNERIQKSVHARRRAAVGIAVFSLTCLIAGGMPIAQDRGWRPISDLDIRRVEELYHIAGQLGDSLWPGFDIRSIPIAINNADRQELLIGHPAPPEEYVPYTEYALEGRNLHMRDGSSRYGPSGGGWATDVGDVYCAYVGVIRENQTTEDYLSLLLHECFHVYQRRYRESADGPLGELPELDPVYSSLIGLESRIFHAALHSDDEEEISTLARMCVAVRMERRRGLPEDVIRSENEEEFNEGTATYIQARMLELLARRKVVESKLAGADPQYRGFERADSLYESFLDRIPPPEDMVIPFFHAKYHVGMAQCLLLDRVRPLWKEEMREKGATQFDVMMRQFPIDTAECDRLLRTAKHAYGYDALLREQQALVEEQTAVLRGYLEVPGRRFRIYYGTIQGSFRWKPKGPVYPVPLWLLLEIEEKLALDEKYREHVTSNVHSTIWAGGISPLEIGEMRFESKEVPILFRKTFLEWVDPAPEADGSDIIIRSSRREDNVYYDLVLKTDGFTLSVPKARIDKSENFFAVFPISRPESNDE